mmetsp:Transcript_96998/g.301946  ORF Transcript_96998/g.301946 Transcript_96998/m.301946 type:complete len:277 (+) Transcript_96998:943-1773(+)
MRGAPVRRGNACLGAGPRAQPLPIRDNALRSLPGRGPPPLAARRRLRVALPSRAAAAHRPRRLEGLEHPRGGRGPQGEALGLRPLEAAHERREAAGRHPGLDGAGGHLSWALHAADAKRRRLLVRSRRPHDHCLPEAAGGYHQESHCGHGQERCRPSPHMAGRRAPARGMFHALREGPRVRPGGSVQHGASPRGGSVLGAAWRGGARRAGPGPHRCSDAHEGGEVGPAGGWRLPAAEQAAQLPRVAQFRVAARPGGPGHGDLEPLPGRRHEGGRRP